MQRLAIKILGLSKMQTFENDDEGYLKWVDANPTGFVINAERRQYGEAPYMLHRANCTFITTRERTNYTTTTYKKICSLDKQELIAWWRKYSSRYQECKFCKP
jgi:hypothetical protein